MSDSGNAAGPSDERAGMSQGSAPGGHQPSIEQPETGFAKPSSSGAHAVGAAPADQVPQDEPTQIYAAPDYGRFGSDSNAQQPEYGQQQYAEPQYGQPQYGQQQRAEPQYGQQQYGQQQ